jgi:hypothetical protein
MEDSQGASEFAASGLAVFIAVNLYLIITIPLWLWLFERFQKVAARPQDYQLKHYTRAIKGWFKKSRRCCTCKMPSWRAVSGLGQVLLMLEGAVTWRSLWANNKIRLFLAAGLMAGAVAAGRQLHALVLLAAGQEGGDLLEAPDLQASSQALKAVSSSLQTDGSFILFNIFIITALPCLLYAVYSSCNPQARQITLKLPSLRSCGNFCKSGSSCFKQPLKLYKKLPAWAREIFICGVVLVPCLAALLGYETLLELAQTQVEVTGLQAFVVLNLIFAAFSIPLAFVVMRLASMGQKLWRKVFCGGRRQRGQGAVA